MIINNASTFMLAFGLAWMPSQAAEPENLALDIALVGLPAALAAASMEVAPDMKQVRLPPYAYRAQDMRTLRAV